MPRRTRRTRWTLLVLWMQRAEPWQMLRRVTLTSQQPAAPTR